MNKIARIVIGLGLAIYTLSMVVPSITKTPIADAYPIEVVLPSSSDDSGSNDAAYVAGGLVAAGLIYTALKPKS